MNDLLPDDCDSLQSVLQKVNAVLKRYHYQRIETPLLERTELFARSVGTATDIVEKEMYTFLDRNQDSLSLRP